MPNCNKGAKGLGGYHSVKEGVHHLFAECPDGAPIPDEDCRSGNGGKPRCTICQNMADGKASELRRGHYGP